jgi:hypothetical protein
LPQSKRCSATPETEVRIAHNNLASQLRLNHPIEAQRLTARFIENGNKPNNTVLAFGFNYCRFKFIRYGS